MTKPPASAGCPLHVSSAGVGDPPLVLIHGFGAHGAFWRKWQPHLAREHRTHTVDLLGFGSSPAPAGADYSPAGQARLLADCVGNFDGGPPVLVGHSLGGGIALLTALLLKDRSPPCDLAGLVLVSAAASEQSLPPFLTLARTPLGSLFLLGTPPRWAFRLGLRTIVQDAASVNEEQVDVYREPLRSRQRRRAVLRGARQIDPGSARTLAARLGELDVPTLLLWGREDGVVPLELGVQLARTLPDASLVTLPNVGHLPPEEDPLGSVTPVLTFLDSLKGGASGRAP